MDSKNIKSHIFLFFVINYNNYFDFNGIKVHYKYSYYSIIMTSRIIDSKINNSHRIVELVIIISNILMS